MQTIYLDISNKGVIPVIYAKQGDVGRKVEVVLTNAGLPYEPEAGSAFSAWFSGVSGMGNYTDIGGRSAFSVSGNKVTVELITQMLQAGGDGIFCLVLNSANGDQIGLWNIRYLCENVPGAGSAEAMAYYTAFSKAVEGLSNPNLLIESDDHPGCYYRFVNDRIEWLNPPLLPGVEYRTTERFDGKAVYTRLVDCGIAAHNASITIPGVTRCVRYIGYISPPSESYPVKPLPVWSGDTIGTGYHAEVTQLINPYTDGQFIIKTDSAADSIGGGGYTWFVQAWYTKD